MPDGDTMESAHGMEEAPPKVEEKPEWWASSATLGLLGFGLTTILAGLSVGQWTGGGALLSTALFFGGIGQIIAGIIGLRKGNMFAGTAFTSYGLFWLAFVWLNTTYAPTNAYDVPAFFFIWILFTTTFLASAWKHGIGVFLVFLTLWIAFILLTIMSWYAAASPPGLSHTDLQVIGGEIILTGVLAWLTGTADLQNWNYGRKILPL